MAVQALYALQNGFMGAERSLLFYGEYSEARVADPHRLLAHQDHRRRSCCSTPACRRARCPGLMRNDPLARFTEEDLLVHRLDALGLESDNVDHGGDVAPALRPRRRRPPLPQVRAGRAEDEYAYAHYPASFFEPFYYRKNFDLPGYRWRLLDGDTELAPGLTVLRTDGHTPGHQSLLVAAAADADPCILTGDACYWMEHAESERVPGVVWNPTLALHSIKRIKTLARLIGARIFPGPRPGASGRP